MQRIVSLNVALPSVQRYGDEEVFTGGAKRPVSRALLRREGFDGDGQADRRHHGGPDKAVCVYSFDHYPYWEARLGHSMSPGAFSENLTVSGIRETEVRVGDTFRADEALLQVSVPRMPCGKLAAKNGKTRLAKWVSEAGYTGFYMRVLQEGIVGADGLFGLIDRSADGVEISRVNDLLYGRSRDMELIERLANLPEFGAEGREMFSEVLRRERIEQS
jgi:MOSC domain-containing protein YiiM